VQNGGMEVVDVYRIGSDVDSVLIGFSKGHSRSHAGSGKPGGEDSMAQLSSAGICCGVEWSDQRI
jgi:hypothetical protein